MAKKEKKPKEDKGQAWLITFSDLVTLLLTFFVLLLSMSSMDKTVLTRVNIFTRDVGFTAPRGAGRIPTRIKLIADLLDNPWDIMEKQNRLKDLLFPDDVLPKDIDRSTLEENIKVLAKPEGVALVLTDNLLFPSGSSELNPLAMALLDQVVEVLGYMTANVNVAGFTDNTPGGTVDNYELSGNRAMAVLNHFVGSGLERPRFTVSGYGPNLPIADNGSEAGRAQNRRVEILVKTNRELGGYATL